MARARLISPPFWDFFFVGPWANRKISALLNRARNDARAVGHYYAPHHRIPAFTWPASRVYT